MRLNPAICSRWPTGESAHRTRRSTRISTIDVQLPPVPLFRHHVEAIALKAVVGLLRPLPVDAASWVMGKLWRHVLPLGRRNRRTLCNLEHVLPELSAEERSKIAAGVRENLGRVFIEAFRLPEFSLDSSRFDLSGASLLADIARGNGNAVIASLHMGNWEACSGAAMQLGLKPAGVYRQLSNPIVEAGLAEARRSFYPMGLFCKRPNSDIARKVLSLVKAGGTLAILGDLRDEDGIELLFLGAPSWATTFPALVARITGAPLVAARLVRTGGVRFRAEAEVIAVPRTDDRRADIEEATRSLSQVFERWVREMPEQWLWTHKKWGRTEDAD